MKFSTSGFAAMPSSCTVEQALRDKLKFSAWPSLCRLDPFTQIKWNRVCVQLLQARSDVDMQYDGTDRNVLPKSPERCNAPWRTVEEWREMLLPTSSHSNKLI